jgi:hypothetical protein
MAATTSAPNETPVFALFVNIRRYTPIAYIIFAIISQ